MTKINSFNFEVRQSGLVIDLIRSLEAGPQAWSVW